MVDFGRQYLHYVRLYFRMNEIIYILISAYVMLVIMTITDIQDAQIIVL